MEDFLKSHKERIPYQRKPLCVWNWLIHYGSVTGGTGWYLVELGQHGAVLAGTCWYWCTNHLGKRSDTPLKQEIAHFDMEKKCFKPSGQVFKPPLLYGQCPYGKSTFQIRSYVMDRVQSVHKSTKWSE